MRTRRRVSLAAMILTVSLAAQWCSAQAASPTDLQALRDKYDQCLTGIQTNTDKTMQDWPQAYVAELKKVEQKLQASGDLDGMLAVQKEIKRFNQEKKIPENAVSESAVLKDLQLKWRKTPEAIELDKSKRIVALAKSYMAALDEAKKQLTKQGKVDQAIEMKNEIERVKTSAPVTAAEFALANAAASVPPEVGKDAKPAEVKPEAGIAERPGTLSADLRAGLVLYYSFDRNDGKKVTDKSGKGNNGKVQGAKWTPEGKVGGAFSFDGSGSTLIDAGNPGDLSKKFSLVVWAYPEVYDGYRCIMGKDTDDNGFSLEKAMDSASMKFWFFDGAWRNTAFRHVPPLKAWSCFAVVHDGNTVRGYFNGEQDTDDIPAAGVVQRKSRVLIGRHPVVEAARNWNGLIDEVMIFDRALTDKEVKKIYDAQK